MTFLKPTHIKLLAQEFVPILRPFAPRLALRAMSSEARPRVNKTTDPIPTTPLSNRQPQTSSFWKHLKGLGMVTLGAGSLAAASYFTQGKIEFAQTDQYPHLNPKQSPTEEKLQTILKPWNKATATTEIFLLSEKILHELHTAICQTTYGPSPIALKAMPNPSMEGIPDALKTKMENAFTAKITSMSNIEESLSKAYFTGPDAELQFALHVIRFKISAEYSTPYMQGKIPSATMTPQIARDIYEEDSSHLLQAYYAYLNCRELIRQTKEQDEKAFEYRSKGLTALPPEIEQIYALKMLDLQSNRLSYLPEQFGNLWALTYLDLSDNNLKSLPAEIGQLTRLTDLTLNSNRLTGLPPAFKQLQNLKYLYLDYNEFTALPRELLALPNLQDLHILGYLTKGQNTSFHDFTFWEKVMIERIRTKTPSCHVGTDWVRSAQQPVPLMSTADRTKEALISAIISVLK